MKFRRISLTLLLCIALVSMLSAQVARQSGVIRGAVTDNEGTPLPGMTISATSPSMLGTVSDVTNVEGGFRLANLAPGTYTLAAEMPGFKTLKREGIIVQVGAIVTINLQTEPSSISEELTIIASAPTVDVQSTKVGGVVTSEMIQRLPLNRTLTNVFNTIAGSSGKVDTYSGSVHGGASTTVSYEVDGVNSNDPAHNGLLQAPQFDTMEEIEVSTGGLPAQVGNTGGSFVNIVTKSGGNSYSGQLQAYYTNENLLEVLFPDEQLKAMSVGKPTSPINDLDLSGAFGGPIIKDKIWFFVNGGYKKNEFNSAFIPATLSGKFYEQYPNPTTQVEGFAKITTQISKSLRFFAMFNGRVLNQDVAWGGGARTAYDATFSLKNNSWIQATGNLTWLLGSNTFVDIRGGYVNRDYPITGKEDVVNNIGIRDYYSNYSYNGLPTWNSDITRRTFQTSARMTHFQDGFLGGDHEIGAGIEYQWLQDRYGYYRQNPLQWHYYKGNPYYYRSYYGLTDTHPTFGDGRLSFTNCGIASGDSVKDLSEARISAYLQDSWTIKNRLTINLGARFDYYNGWGGVAQTTGITGLPLEIGQTLVSEIGFNPFAAFKMDPIKDVMKFTVLSPRVGLTYDLFGDGKTALKASFSRYAEAVPVMWFQDVSPAVQAQYTFNWFDDNNNGTPDSPGTDHYVPTSGNGQFSLPDADYLKSRVDPKLKTPIYTEYVVSINHELFKDFSIKAQYMHKLGENPHGWALYDRAADKFWYSYEQAPDYWVPFTTTVPAYGNYPAQEVTAYFMSNNAPFDDQFYLQTLMSESKRKYDAVELTFDKRFSQGWGLGGSIVLSKHLNDITSDDQASFYPDPNSYVNADGRDPNDQPLAIKLWGSFDLPWGFIGSFFYRHNDGSPYGRRVNVSVPEDWAIANNVNQNYGDAYVYVEPIGSRRNQSYDNVDLRFEKQFDVRLGRLGVFIDVYNLLGNRYIYYGQNPGGTWAPTGFGGSTGSYSNISSTYGKPTSIDGSRIYKFSVRFTF
ncbi:MAG: TonB-dependent receptor [Candidatus Aminicenantales bacterium]